MDRSRSRSRTPKPSKRRKGRRLKRGFVQVSLVEAGHQSGSSRSESINTGVWQDRPLPLINPWRNNLTGLSKHHNLYFVACEDTIYVYEPSFPAQKLPAHATVILPLPRTGPNLPGHIPGSNPHSINQLLVSDLGSAEVVACVCDDGDIIAWHTSSIWESRLRQERTAQDQVKPTSLRPFFHHNVGNSAWGLAIHSEARMIAVSCNSKFVFVFAFALVDGAPTQSMDEDGLEIDGHGWACFSTMDAGWRRQFRHRTRNLKLTLGNEHDDNIPSVAFCNTPEDSNGHFLASTDIMGVTVIWNLEFATPWRCLTPEQEGDSLMHYDPRRAGWAAFWIDSRAFNVARGASQCWGGHEEIRERRGAPFVVGTGQSAKHVARAGRWNVHEDGERRRPTRRPVNPPVIPVNTTDETDQDRGVEDGNEDEGDGDDDNDDYDDDGNQTAIASSATSTAGDSNGPQSVDDDDVSATEDLYDQDAGIMNEDEAAALNSVDELAAAITQSLDQSDDDDDDDDDDDGDSQQGLRAAESTVYAAARRQMEISRFAYFYRFWPALTFATVSNDWCTAVEMQGISYREPQCPFMHLMPKAVHLFQSAKFYGDNAKDDPAFFLDDPLHQDMEDRWMSALERYDRMNLYVQIPELGVVVVGSPKGRAAVLSLHQTDENPWSARSLKPMYSLRLDWLLPFNDQEERGQRPLQQLVGISAAPLQGCYDKTWRRPWRIMMLYRDHTVLSYEVRGHALDQETFESLIVI